jgi:hypothetical protein
VIVGDNSKQVSALGRAARSKRAQKRARGRPGIRTSERNQQRQDQQGQQTVIPTKKKKQCGCDEEESYNISSEQLVSRNSPDPGIHHHGNGKNQKNRIAD